MMLRCNDEVLGSSIVDQVNPLLWIVALGRELRERIVIVPFRPKCIQAITLEIGLLVLGV